MNVLIHSFDRFEPPRRPGLGALLRSGLAKFAAALRYTRERQALDHLAHLNDHLLRDIGLTRDELRPGRPLSDGRWLIDSRRLGER